MKMSPRKPFHIEVLEPRILLSADLNSIALPTLESLGDSSITSQDIEAASAAGFFADLTAETDTPRHEIIFIDSGVDAYRQMVDAIRSEGDPAGQIDLFVLESGQDGIVQISEILAGYSNLDAVHLISHGENGVVHLGNSQLTTENIIAYEDSVGSWKAALADDADLLFYGCNLAAGESGQDLADSLAVLTGADVAASDDLTGHSTLGGDWDLEYRTGLIEAEIAINDQLQMSWTAVLAPATISDDFSTGDYSGSTGSLPWTSTWSEGGGGETTDPAAGAIQVVGGAVRFDGSSVSINNKAIERHADISTAVTAMLSFEYKREFASDSTMTITLAESGNGGVNWDTIVTYNLTGTADADFIYQSFDITDHISANFQFRFTGSQGPLEANSYFYFDNPCITFSTGAADSTAPTQTNNTGTSVAEGGTDPISRSELRYDDDLQVALDVTYSVTGGPANGQLELVSNPGVAINSFTQADIDNGRLLYVHDGSETGADSFTFDVDDGQGNTLVGETFSITVSAVNDNAPLITSPAAANVAENSTAVHQITVTDSDQPGDSFTYSIIGGADQALFAIDGSGNLSFAAAPNFEAPADTDTNNVYEVEVRVNDGINDTSQVIMVTVTDANEAPSATNLSAAESYSADTALNLTDIVVSDVDGDNLTVTLTLSDPGAGSLSTGTSGAVTSAFDGATGVWTASGASSGLNNLLAGVIFTPSTAYSRDFIIATSVSDGIAPPSTGTKTVACATVIDDLTYVIEPDETTADPSPTSEDTLEEPALPEPEGQEVTSDEETGPVVDGQEADSVTASAANDIVEKIRKEGFLQDQPGRSGLGQLLQFGVMEGNDGMENSDSSFLANSLTDAETTSQSSGKDSASQVGRSESDTIKRDLTASMARTRTALDGIDNSDKIIIKTISTATVSISVGVATWVLRGGSLLASWLTSIPFWKEFDLLPVLSLTGAQRRAKMEEVRKEEADEGVKNKVVAELFDSTRREHGEKNGDGNKS